MHHKKIARAKAPNWQVGNLKRFLSIFILTNFRATMYWDSVLEITGNHQVVVQLDLDLNVAGDNRMI